MILRLAHFFSIIVLSLALSCTGLNYFRCKYNLASNSMLAECRNKNQFMVCKWYYVFNEYTGMSLNNVEPAVVETETGERCEQDSYGRKGSIYCTGEDCDMSLINAVQTCRLNTLLCGQRIFLNAENNKLHCFILLKPPAYITTPQHADNYSKIVDWKREEDSAGPNSNLDGCSPDVGWGVRRYCTTTECDMPDERGNVKSAQMHLRECFSDQTITCGGVEYIVAMNNMRKQYDRESAIKAACSVDIRLVNETHFHRTSSFRESGDPDSCTAVDILSQSISLLCDSDNCDKASEQDLMTKCNVEIFQCGNKKRFLNLTTSTGDFQYRYCKYEISLKAGNSSLTEYSILTSRGILKPGCHEENGQHFFYCERNCNSITMSTGMSKCLTDVIEEDNSRSRLLLSIFMPIITILILVPIFTGGFCALRSARAAFAYEEEKYQTEFGVPFGESMPEVDEMTKKKSGLSTGRKTSKTGHSTPTHKNTVKSGKNRNTSTVKSGRTTARVKGDTTGRVNTTSKAEKQSTVE